MEDKIDKDVLDKATELSPQQAEGLSSLAEFHRDFQHYQRAKTAGQAEHREICRPYTEAFSQPPVAQKAHGK